MSKHPCWQYHPDVLALYEQHNVSFGAWAIILHIRAMFANPAREYDEDHVARIAASHLDPRLDQHGEPPREFVRAWLIDDAATWGFLAVDTEDALLREDARNRLAAARELWRRYAGGAA